LTMKQNVLIHLHPTFFDFCQSLCSSEKIYGGFDSITCLNGPSIQSSRLCKSYAEWLFDARRVFEELWNCPVKFQGIGFRIFFIEYCRVIARACFRERGLDIPTVFKYAAKDSIIRSRISYAYLTSPYTVRRVLEKIWQVRGLALRNIYKKLLKENGTSIVISSHAVYIGYTSLIQAAQELGIDCIVHDTYRTSIVKGVCHIYDASHHMKDAFGSYDLFVRQGETSRAGFISSNAIAADTGSSSSSSTDAGAASFVVRKKKRMLVLLPHIFKDANYGTDPSRWLYRDYFAWLIETLKILVLEYSGFDLIVYKVHPHARRFQEEGLMSFLGRLLYLGRNRSRVRVVESDQSISDIVPDYDHYIVTPVTFQGSTCFENGACGYGTVAVGNPPCPESAIYHPESKASYKQAIQDPKITLGLCSLDESCVEECKKQLAVYTYTRLPDSLYRQYSVMLQDGFYFGTSGHKRSDRDWVERVDAFRRSFDLRVVKLSQTFSVVEYLRSQNSKSQ